MRPLQEATGRIENRKPCPWEQMKDWDGDWDGEGVVLFPGALRPSTAQGPGARTPLCFLA